MENKDKINVFISYAHDDKYDHDDKITQPYEEFEKFIIKAKQLSDLIGFWSDAEIDTGENWDEKIKQNLHKADIVILVISQAFYNSQYIETELKIAFKKHEENKCIIIPLYFEFTNVDKTVSAIQGYPSPEKFINQIDEKNRPGAYSTFQKIIKEHAEKLIKKKENEKRSARSEETVVKPQLKPVNDVGLSPDTIQNTKLVEGNDNIYAVIIANYKFSNLEDKNIPNVHTNLKDLEKAFKIDLNFKNVYTVDNKNCADIQTELEWIIKKCQVDSTLLLYYSGHGLIESNSFYLASENTKLDPDDNKKLLKTSAVSAQNVKDLLEECKAKYKVLIFDCCYSSAFLNHSLSVDDNRFIKQKFAIKDTYYLFSSVETEVSLYPAEEPDRPTYFTEALLKALKTGVEPEYEYCSLEQIFELTKGELEKIKDPSGIPVPKAIKPDNVPLGEIKICANPKYDRRRTGLSKDFINLSTVDIIAWANTSRNDPEIEKALNTLIKRHQDDIDLILIDTDGMENTDISDKEKKDKLMLEKMIKFLRKAIEKKHDLETFKNAFRLYEKTRSEYLNPQKDNPANNAALLDERDSQSQKNLLENENLKAEPKNTNQELSDLKKPADERDRQAQFKQSN